jgi:hypothetical protein
MQTDSILTPLTSPITLGVPNTENASGSDFRGVAAQPDWPELVRDLTAMANSGGGRLEASSNISLHELLNQLSRYTTSDFADIAIEEPLDGAPGTIINIGPAHFPIDYRGTLYFRHDGRSEPVNAADIRRSFQRLLNKARGRWSRSLRRALNTPVDRLTAPPRTRSVSRPPSKPTNLQPVRITNDLNAPALHPQDVDRLYPWRQKDLVRELNRRFGKRLLNSYDIQAIRRHHRLDDHPDFIFNLPGAGRRYSPAAADWIAHEHARDADFFHKARAADQKQLKLRRKKPK